MSEEKKSGFSRRGFLRGAGVTAAGTLMQSAQALARETAEAAHEPLHMGPGAVPLTLHINGQQHPVQVEPRDTLATTLRDKIGLTGTKVVCDRGSCSACTIWLDTVPALACMTLAVDVGERKVTTIEGLSDGDHLHPVQAAFVKHDAMQCGFCTPGMVMSCAALLARNPHPTLGDVKHATSGNLCRCGTYPKVFAATLDAAQGGSSMARLIMPHGTREA